MTTNDEQAGYGEPKREPMLSDEVCRWMMKEDYALMADHPMEPKEAWFHGLLKATNYYENLITTGKLRVVDEVKLTAGNQLHTYQCSHCGWMNPPRYYRHCPGCGNKIKQ